MLIESLEKKTKLAMFTVLLAISASTVICGLCFYIPLAQKSCRVGCPSLTSEFPFQRNYPAQRL